MVLENFIRNSFKIYLSFSYKKRKKAFYKNYS